MPLENDDSAKVAFTEKQVAFVPPAYATIAYVFLYNQSCWYVRTVVLSLNIQIFVNIRLWSRYSDLNSVFECLKVVCLGAAARSSGLHLRISQWYPSDTIQKIESETSLSSHQCFIWGSHHQNGLAKLGVMNYLFVSFGFGYLEHIWILR